jgi:phospholipid/cholesterol/gamma-HCH transport system substrate-binding protein
MTIARGAALGALIAAVVAVAMLMFGGSGAKEYDLYFQTAGQLVNGNQVEVAGKPVGKIKDIELTDDNQAKVRIEVNDDFAPLHEGTTAVVRVLSLPSVANRHVSLTPGPNSAPEIEEGGVIPTDRTNTPVDLDQLFNTLDPETRKSLQQVLYGFANWYGGRGGDLNRTLRYFGPALGSTAELMRELGKDQKIFTDFIIDGSRVVSALADRRDDVAGFVSNTNATFRAIGDENVALGRALGLLPSTLRRANTTFVRLRGALNDLDDLTNATKPIAPELAPFFRRLNTMLRTARPTFHDFSLLIAKKGRDNDFLDLLRDLPPLAKVSRPAFANSIRALKKGQPVIDFIRPYAPDFAGWITKFSQATSPYDANGHYARVQPIFNAFSFQPNAGNGVLNPVTPAQRKAIITDRRNDRRCPGGATQPAPDGSNPFTDGGGLTAQDCDPALRPPGP